MKSSRAIYCLRGWTRMIVLIATTLAVILLGGSTIGVAGAAHDHDAHDDDGDDSKPARFEAWLYAILSSIVLSLISLLALIVLTVRSKAVGYAARMGFVGLGAGSMLATALLTLIPEGIEVLESTAVGGLALAGIFVGMAIEVLTYWFHPAHEHPNAPKPVCPEEPPVLDVHIEESSSMSAAHKPKVHHSALAWNNVIGDGIHNFADGVLLGLVYLSSLRQGVLVSLAVACHEIPQELGDYFILIHSGWSPRRSLLFNFGSACMAVVGAVIGLLIGETFESVIAYCLPIVGGQFLYISLSQLLPEMMEMKWSNAKFISFTGVAAGGALVGSLLALPEEWGHGHGG